MAEERASRKANSPRVFGHPGKRTQVRSVDQLPPLEIVLEVRGTQAIPTNSALLLNGPYGRLPVPATDHFQAIHNQ